MVSRIAGKVIAKLSPEEAATSISALIKKYSCAGNPVNSGFHQLVRPS
ncbi:MAG: hypothetical protein QXX18_07190 [Candidatus Jordarchaeales archaeon]